MSVRVGFGQGKYNKGLYNQTLGEALSANAVAALSTTVSAFTRLRTLASTVLGAGTFASAIQKIQSSSGKPLELLVVALCLIPSKAEHATVRFEGGRDSQ